MSFLTVARVTELEDLIKGSRFIAWVARAKSVEKANAFLEEARTKYPDASHHTWAYRIGDAYRYSDDGEPGGTAGRPMLEVLTRRRPKRGGGSGDALLRRDETRRGGFGARLLWHARQGARRGGGGVEIKPQVRMRVAVPFTEMDTVHRLLDDWPAADERNARIYRPGDAARAAAFRGGRGRFTGKSSRPSRGAPPTFQPLEP